MGKERPSVELAGRAGQWEVVEDVISKWIKNNAMPAMVLVALGAATTDCHAGAAGWLDFYRQGLTQKSADNKPAPVAGAASVQPENRATSLLRDREAARLLNMRRSGIPDEVVNDPTKNWKPWTKIQWEHIKSRGYDPMNHDRPLPPLFFGKPHDDAVFVHAPGINVRCRDLKLAIYTDRVIVEHNGTSKTHPIVLTQGEINLDAHNTTDSHVVAGQPLPKSDYWMVEFGRLGMQSDAPVSEFTLEFTLQSDADRNSIRHHSWTGSLYGPTIEGFSNCQP
jgi:hypothetical protein